MVLDETRFSASRRDDRSRCLRWLSTQQKISFQDSGKAFQVKDPKIESLLPHLFSHSSPVSNQIAQISFKTAPRVAILFSGGPAPGGHNVVWGVAEALWMHHPDAHLFGILGGPKGLLDKRFQPLMRPQVDYYINQGGFEMLGTGRTKIETKEDFEQAAKVCQELNLTGLIVVGGDDSNTNAALLANYFFEKGLQTKVVGVPKTIDGDLQSKNLPISFGFDSASKVYSQLISNLAKDTLSSRKYFHFTRLMGRSASHLTLECALQTKPTYALLSEECEHKKMTLLDVAEELARVTKERISLGKPWGVYLIPEGLIEFLPDVKTLLEELESLKISSPKEAVERLKNSGPLWDSLPDWFQKALFTERDPHGNFPLSQVKTEELLIDMVKHILQRGDQKTASQFAAIGHFFGYEGRCCFPTPFDCAYTFALGVSAATLILSGKSGYIALVQGLHLPMEQWTLAADPLISMLHLEQRKGTLRPVIAKALVSLDSPAYHELFRERNRLIREDLFRILGPTQFPDFSHGDLVPGKIDSESFDLPKILSL